jgi:hypothetical protein
MLLFCLKQLSKAKYLAVPQREEEKPGKQQAWKQQRKLWKPFFIVMMLQDKLTAEACSVKERNRFMQQRVKASTSTPDRIMRAPRHYQYPITS